MGFATALSCMDGRIHIPVIEYLRRKYGVDWVDMITEPGISRLLSGIPDSEIVEAFRRKTEISSRCHGSRLVAVVGHHDCAANCADEEVQRGQTRAALRTVRNWNLGMRVVGLWIDETWEVHEVE